MMYCPKCGTSNNVGSRFCKGCGHAFAPDAGAPSAPGQGQPFAPEPGYPSAPGTGQPFAPEPGYPSAPGPGQPFAPGQGHPYAPEPGNPFAPQMGQPYSYGNQAPDYYGPGMGYRTPVKKKSKAIMILAIAGGAVLLAAAVILGIWFINDGNRSLTVDELIDLGNKYLLDMDYEQAIIAFRNAIDIEPRNIPARLGLSEAYIGLERYGEAEEVLLEVLDIDRGNIDAQRALMSLAMIYRDLGHYSNAERVSNTLLNTDRRNPDIYVALQNLYELMEDFDNLARILDEMRELGLEQYMLFGEVVGRVIDGAGDPANAIPLAGVEIATFRNGEYERRLYSDRDGLYVIFLRSGSHEQSAEMDGYLPFVQQIEVEAGEIQYMQAIELIPIPVSGTVYESEGSVSGQIIDMITGYGISRAVIEVFDQQQVKIDEVYADNNGYYDYSNIAGYYVIRSSYDGYMASQRTVTIIDSTEMINRNLSMTPILEDGEIRIVLTWGRYPEDLDSHLLGPLSSGEWFHVYFDDKEAFDNNILVAYLDLDDTESYGPETTTIYRAVDESIYSFAVHDYTNRGASNSTALADSGANVKVYVGNDYMREFNVPPGLVGDTWYVFDIFDGNVTTPLSPEWYWDDFWDDYGHDDDFWDWGW